MLKTIRTFTYLSAYLVGTLPTLRKARRLKKEGKEPERCELMANKAHDMVDSVAKEIGITFDIKGLENIPDGAVLYTANHQGLFDAFIMLAKMREPCGFLIKKEASSIPILSTWMREMKCVFVDRENPREAVKAINAGVDIINSGRSLVVFPEGTRSKGKDLGEFKNGAFKIAQKTGCPIVPVAIEGSYKVWEEHNRINKAHVTVRVLEPIFVKDMSREEFKGVAISVRDKIQKAKDEITGE